MSVTRQLMDLVDFHRLLKKKKNTTDVKGAQLFFLPIFFKISSTEQLEAKGEYNF